jgi:hypothetical protein
MRFGTDKDSFGQIDFSNSESEELGARGTFLILNRYAIRIVLENFTTMDA